MKILAALACLAVTYPASAQLPQSIADLFGSYKPVRSSNARVEVVFGGSSRSPVLWSDAQETWSLNRQDSHNLKALMFAALSEAAYADPPCETCRRYVSRYAPRQGASAASWMVGLGWIESGSADVRATGASLRVTLGEIFPPVSKPPASIGQNSSRWREFAQNRTNTVNISLPQGDLLDTWLRYARDMVGEAEGYRFSVQCSEAEHFRAMRGEKTPAQYVPRVMALKGPEAYERAAKSSRINQYYVGIACQPAGGTVTADRGGVR